MNEPKQPGTGEGSATDQGKVAGSGHHGEPQHGATTETEEYITKLDPLHLVIPTSAKAMAAALMQHADELRRVADRLKKKKHGEHIHVPIVIVFDCNSGGNGA